MIFLFQKKRIMTFLILIFTFQPPAVPTKKPLLFPNSGKNTKYYQYYSLEDYKDGPTEESSHYGYLE